MEANKIPRLPGEGRREEGRKKCLAATPAACAAAGRGRSTCVVWVAPRLTASPLGFLTRADPACVGGRSGDAQMPSVILHRKTQKASSYTPCIKHGAIQCCLWACH